MKTINSLILIFLMGFTFFPVSAFAIWDELSGEITEITLDMVINERLEQIEAENKKEPHPDVLIELRIRNAKTHLQKALELEKQVRAVPGGGPYRSSGGVTFWDVKREYALAIVEYAEFKRVKAELENGEGNTLSKSRLVKGAAILWPILSFTYALVVGGQSDGLSHFAAINLLLSVFIGGGTLAFITEQERHGWEWFSNETRARIGNREYLRDTLKQAKKLDHEFQSFVKSLKSGLVNPQLFLEDCNKDFMKALLLKP